LSWIANISFLLFPIFCFVIFSTWELRRVASFYCRIFLGRSSVEHFCIDRVSNIFASFACQTFLRQSLTADLSSLTMRNKLVCWWMTTLQQMKGSCSFKNVYKSIKILKSRSIYFRTFWKQGKVLFSLQNPIDWDH
jgi:hypothetical protein